MTLSPIDLVGQFILSKSRDSIPKAWRCREMDGWYLGYHPSLRVFDIKSSGDGVIGWLLGYAIDSQAHLVNEDVRFEVTKNARDAADQFESSLYRYGGRFAAVYLGSQDMRLYLDPLGSLSAVYCPEKKIAAATETLIPSTANPKEDYNEEYIQKITTRSRDGYFPFGLTQRRSVKRLLPNHFLDIASWQAKRHWPTGELIPGADVQSSVKEMIFWIKNNISAIARDYNVYMSLTAGRDSRVLLACARQWREKVTCVTFGRPNTWTELDSEVARKMARYYKLDYRYLPFKQPSEKEVEDWRCRTGRSITGSQWVRTYNRLNPEYAVFMGAGGEVGRGFHWRDGDTETSAIMVDDLLEKRAIEITDEVRQEAQKWLDELPVQNTLTTWGLLYNELFNGCWFGPLFYGFVDNAMYISPFCYRRILELMLTMPTEYRRKNQLPIDILQSEWPDLLRFPFNWPIGMERILYALQRRWHRLMGK